MYHEPSELSVRVVLKDENVAQFRAVKKRLGLQADSEVFRHLMVDYYNQIQGIVPSTG